MDVIVKYIDELLERSTPEAPMWNIEKIKQGLKSNWNYIDGCMIKAVLEMYSISKDKKYLDFADAFIDYRVHDDGTIEGIEKDNVIGVQWHPESVLDMEIFDGFVTKKLQLSIGMISSTEK